MLSEKIVKTLNPNLEKDSKEENSLLDTLNKVITLLSHSQQQIKYWHWQTESYAEHMNFGNYYDNIGELLDTFTEGAISICGRPTQITTMEFKNYEAMCACDHLESLCEQFYNITKDVAQYKDLENTCADILALLHKTKYLLTLK
jgi:DNA-binding ferritin-like protein